MASEGNEWIELSLPKVRVSTADLLSGIEANTAVR